MQKPPLSIDNLPQPGRKTFAVMAAALLATLLCLLCGFFALSATGTARGPDVAAIAPTFPGANTAVTSAPIDTLSPTPTPQPAPTVVPSDTPPPTPSNTPVPDTATPTDTAIPPTETATETPSPTASASPTNTPTATPTATATTIPTATRTPTPIPTPSITFSANPATIVAGQCATLSWAVDHAQSAYLSGGQFGAPPGLGVGGHITTQVCPTQSTTYVLRVNSSYGAVDTARLLTVVAPTPVPPTILLDLVQAAPSASWFNGSGTSLPWNGSTGDPHGFAVWWQGNAVMEDGSRPPLALETHPEWIDNGSIYGQYPQSVQLRTGDRLRVLAGFLQGANAGNATYRVTFSYPCGGEFACSDLLTQFGHAYNGGLVSQLISLSAENGRTGKFMIAVDAGASSAQDWATWVVARVERP